MTSRNIGPFLTFLFHFRAVVTKSLTSFTKGYDVIQRPLKTLEILIILTNNGLIISNIILVYFMQFMQYYDIMIVIEKEKFLVRHSDWNRWIHILLFHQVIYKNSHFLEIQIKNRKWNDIFSLDILR